MSIRKGVTCALLIFSLVAIKYTLFASSKEDVNVGILSKQLAELLLIMYHTDKNNIVEINNILISLNPQKANEILVKFATYENADQLAPKLAAMLATIEQKKLAEFSKDIGEIYSNLMKEMDEARKKIAPNKPELQSSTVEQAA